VPAEDPILRWILRAPQVVNAQVAREVDAGSCGEGGVRQSVAGIVVVEKNAAFRLALLARGASPFNAHLQGWQGQFWGQSTGQSAGA
jgi:hypothetical protein